MFVRGIGRRSVGTALQTSAFTNMSSTYQELNFVPSYPALPYLKGGRVMIAFFVNYSTVAFPLHLPTLKRQQFFGAVANSLGKNSYFLLPLDVRCCVAPTGEEVDARQRGVN